MKATPVDRYTFSVEEVVAAILPHVGHRREVELRVDLDGYVVIDIVQPLDQPRADDREMDPAEKPASSVPPEADEATTSERGPAESEALNLCALPLFRAFLEVKTDEAARKILAERSHVTHLSELDRTKSRALNLRYVVEEFEAWKIS